jgi:eukaryotic-like serine/threonine-protein kinase
MNTKVPRDLETICSRCLAKEPQRRYSSAAALAADLRRFEEGRCQGVRIAIAPRNGTRPQHQSNATGI